MVIIQQPIIDKNNKVSEKDLIKFQTNFNYNEISNLFSNLSSLSYWKLFELKKIIKL